MSKVFIEESSLTAIGDAIRAKSGATELMSPAAMVTAIENISTGGGGGGEVVVTTDLGYFNYGGRFSDEVLANIKTENITNRDLESAFANCQHNVDMSGFVINMNTSYQMEALQLFNGCYNLEKLPVFKGTAGMFYRARYMFQNCYSLREIPNDFFTKWTRPTTALYGNTWNGQSLFSGCTSLRELPDLSCYNGWSTNTSSTWSFYYTTFSGCTSLNKIENLPVFNQDLNATVSFFSSITFYNCARLNKLTFATNNGTPYSARWKNQTIDLSYGVGYAADSAVVYDITNRNSGITTASQVSDAATYQALKDTDDWYAYGGVDSNGDAAPWRYSRYGHPEAVETINSLPDTTVMSSPNNTIKFKKYSGMYSSGAIYDLTTAEIAVATAKGWTVTFID